MATDLATSNVDQEMTVEQQIAHLRELFADAPEVGRSAFENVFNDLTSQASETPPPPVVSAGRAGIRLGKVSELTIIIPLAPGGAERTRAFLRLLNGNLAGADEVGSVHNMRFVFLDNDTRMLFATAYDGDWDTYIDDFATKIPDYLDIIDSAWELPLSSLPAVEEWPWVLAGQALSISHLLSGTRARPRFFGTMRRNIPNCGMGRTSSRRTFGSGSARRR